MDIEKIGVDLDKQARGVWVEVDGETSLCVARMNNPEFNKMVEKLSKPYRYGFRKGLLDDEKANEIFDKVLAETVLVDWRGLKRDGVEIKYSPEESYKILKDPALVVFKEMVVQIATDEANFRDEEISASKKKSSVTSTGSDSGATS